MAHLAQLARDANSNQLKDMLLVFFERENELDFALSRQMSQMAGQYTDSIAQRLELIGELEKLQGSILAYETVKLLRDVNDADLFKARAFMTAISQIQIKVLKKISFLVQMRGKKWLDLAYFDHEPHMIDYMLQKQCYMNDSHYDMHLIFYVNGRGLHFGRREFSLIIRLRFGEVLIRERNGGVVEKLEFNEDFYNLSTKFCDELNKEFLKLFKSPSCSSGLGCLDLDIDEDADEFKMHLEEEEMLLFKEEKKMEKDNTLRLEEEARLMRKEEKLLEDEQRSKIDYKKREYALMNSEHMKQAMARMVPKKRSHCTGVTSSTWLKVSSKFKDKSQGHCVINQDMPEFLKNVKPWVERIWTCILDNLACFIVEFHGVMIGRLIESSGSVLRSSKERLAIG
ncbi:hypothetical protein Tco_0448378 [Tanacetum coccineum]